MTLKAVFRRPWVGPLVALVVVYALIAALRPDTFPTLPIAVTMARQTVVVAIVAVGMTLVIVHGGIDLSVGSSVALTTVVVATMLKSGYGGASAALVGIGVATACGLVVGALVTGLRMAPFIVTLGAMSILRGVAKGIAKESMVTTDGGAGLEKLTLAPPFDWMVLPLGVWIAIAIALLAAALLRYTAFGRHVFAIGSNEHAARLCGVDVARVKILVYVIAGALTGIAGVMEFSTLTVGDPTDSNGLELDVIASVVIGGASLSGGEGSIAGSLVGACLMTVIRTGCTHVGLPNWVQQVVTGVIIVAAVALDRLRHARSK
jgi:ribose transport system permease protein